MNWVLCNLKKFKDCVFWGILGGYRLQRCILFMFPTSFGIVAMAESVLYSESHFSSPVMSDFNLMYHIFSFISSPQDRLSASLVCHLWNKVMITRTQYLVIKSRSLCGLLMRFSCIKELDASRCCDEITDSDLILASPFLHGIQTLLIGHPDSPQKKISNVGLRSAASYCSFLHKIVLSSLENISDDAIVDITKSCPCLRVVSLEDCLNLGDASLKAICKLNNMQEITLKGKFGFTSEGLGIIGGDCPSLLKVCLEFCSLEVGYALKSISTGCPLIQELSLKARTMDLWCMAKCSTLTCLRVEMGATSAPIDLDEMVIAVVEANKNIKELVFRSQYDHPKEATIVRVIQRCQKLEKLHINAIGLTGLALHGLMDCRSLKSLALDSGKGFQDIEFQRLMECSHMLEFLDLRRCISLSRDGFCSIAFCKNLQALNLSFTNVDDFSLMVVADNVKRLKKLTLVKCEMITDVEIIADFSVLESLNLDQCYFVNDDALQTIALGCTKLVDISIAFTKVTDDGLKHLVHCCQLRSLNIAYCKYVEGRGVIAISEACTWFRFVQMSYRFSGSNIVKELNRKFFMVHLEFDELALVPFV